MSGYCEHEFVFDIDMWMGDAVDGTVRCTKCGRTGSFRADIYLLEKALATFQDEVEIELAEEEDEE